MDNYRDSMASRHTASSTLDSQTNPDQAFAPSVSSASELESTYTPREADNIHLQGPGPTPNMRNMPLPPSSPAPPMPAPYRPGSSSPVAGNSANNSSAGTPNVPPSSFYMASPDMRRDQLKKLRRNTEDERRFKEVAMQLGLLDTEGEPDLSLNPLPAFVSSSRVDDETEHLDDGAPARASGDTQTFATFANGAQTRYSRDGEETGFSVDLERDAGAYPEDEKKVDQGLGLGFIAGPLPTELVSKPKEKEQDITQYVAFRSARSDGHDSDDEEKAVRGLGVPPVVSRRFFPLSP